MKRKPVDLFLREVIRWEPDQGFLRVDHHIRRITRSADALGFRAPNDPIKQLKAHVAGATPLAVNVQMNHRGELQITSEPYTAIPVDSVWNVKIATKTKLDSADTFYRHKSTRREPYIAARSEYDPKEINEVLLLNERGEICEGTETSIFLPDGSEMLLTPPLESGILPGVLRAELIRERKAKGQVLRPADLNGKEFYVGNSLHGLVRAKLA